LNFILLVLSNPTLVSSNLLDPPSLIKTNSKTSPPPLTSVESLLHGTYNNDQQRHESPISQVRSSVEKNMNQLQQELLHGFPHTQATRVYIFSKKSILFNYFNRNNDQ
jgi:hypothetical protein